MGYTKLQSDPSYLFTIRFKLSTGWVTMRAWEGGREEPNHTRLICEMSQNGKVIFEKGQAWCGIPGHQSIDGLAAKECVASLFAMKPGDTDRDYFEGYTPEQLAWAEQNGEELSMLKSDRYCDENGNVRGGK